MIQAGVINSGIALSGVRVGLHGEMSTFCYLLAAETHRDGDTGDCI
jgi:hypothetical protein